LEKGENEEKKEKSWGMGKQNPERFLGEGFSPPRHVGWTQEKRQREEGKEKPKGEHDSGV